MSPLRRPLVALLLVPLVTIIALVVYNLTLHAAAVDDYPAIVTALQGQLDDVRRQHGLLQERKKLMRERDVNRAYGGALEIRAARRAKLLGALSIRPAGARFISIKRVGHDEWTVEFEVDDTQTFIDFLENDIEIGVSPNRVHFTSVAPGQQTVRVKL
jgi:hypothetical protein